MGSDRLYGHCTREELASGLPQEEGGTFAHRLEGSCKCGRVHGEKPRLSIVKPGVGKRTAWEIRSTDGELVAVHVRKDFSNGDKSFSWERNGKLGLDGLAAADLPLYRSERLAADRGTVILTEGQKAADALAGAGFLSLGTVTGASGTPSLRVLESLHGRDVVLWPDLDEPGKKHMQRIAEALGGVASSIRMLAWGERGKDDAADFFARGGTAEQLDQMLAEAPEWTGRENETPVFETLETDPETVPAGWLRPGDVLRHSPLPKARFVSTFPALNRATKDQGLPTGALIVVQGPPDSGKTGAAIQDALHIGMDYDAVVVIFTPDQGREATAVRVGALLGLDARKLEDRDEEEIGKLEGLLYDRRIFLPDDSAEDGYVEKVIAEAEKIRPDLPHVLVLDSLQEARADERAGEASEKDRTIANVRACRTAIQGPIPWLVLATSQVTKASTSRDPKSRPVDVFAGSDTGKIGFATQMIVGLSGDPAVGPDYGHARVVKNKLGPKQAFGLRLDPVTTKLSEIDSETVDQQKKERNARAREKASSEMLVKVIETLKANPIPEGSPGIATVPLAGLCRTDRRSDAFLDALDAGVAQKVIERVQGPRSGTYYRPRKP